MKLLLLSDLHLVSPDDPNREDHERRNHFTQTRRHLPSLSKAIQRESPDLILCLGDLVDWYSDESRDFALEFLESLSLPWKMTPGNHDASAPPSQGNKMGLQGWIDAGVEIHNRKLDLDGAVAFLLNSHDSNVPPDTSPWFKENLDGETFSILCTHVPPNVPSVREAILAKDPQRNLTRYVQSGAPELFDDALKGKLDLSFSGHLHFPATVECGKTTFHILPLSTKAFGKSYPGEGELLFLDTATKALQRISY